LQHEVEAFGFPLSRHPLTAYREELHRLRPVPADRMAHLVGRRIRMAGWLVTEKAVRTKDGEPMEFVTFEDETALYDATLFPDVYRRVCQLLAPDRAYILEGQVEEEYGAVTLTIHDLRPLAQPWPDAEEEHTDAANG
jgi:error-prone DNA polymerase